MKSTSWCWLSLGSSMIYRMVRKKKYVTFSMLEVEYDATSMASYEVFWLQKLFVKWLEKVLDRTWYIVIIKVGSNFQRVQYSMIGQRTSRSITTWSNTWYWEEWWGSNTSRMKSRFHTFSPSILGCRRMYPSPRGNTIDRGHWSYTLPPSLD